MDVLMGSGVLLAMVLIGVDLLTIGLAWLLVWLTISVARWVRREFHQA
jgi:hypothetical protein